MACGLRDAFLLAAPRSNAPQAQDISERGIVSHYMHDVLRRPPTAIKAFAATVVAEIECPSVL